MKTITPQKKLSEEKIEENWTKATSGNLIKFETPNASLSGNFLSIEESNQFSGSYLVKVTKEDNSVYAVFVSGLVKDLLETNNIQKGHKIKIVFLGKKKTQDGKKEYNAYEVFY